MGLTQVSTDGVKNDAITKTKIPANQIEASELATSAVTEIKIASNSVSNSKLTNSSVDENKLSVNSVVTSKIADQAVTLDKLPHGTSSNDGKFLRANNGADPTFETVNGTTINNNADNRVITGSGTANTLNGESGVQIDASGNLLVGNSTYNNAAFGGSARGINIAQAQPQIVLHETDTDKDGYLGLANSIFRLTTADSIPITFATADTERMRIDSSGNVMIGRTAGQKPLSVRKVDNSSGVHIVQTIGGNNHASGYAVGLGFDPEGNEARNKIAIVAEGIGAGYSRGKLHFLLDSANDSGEATLSESRIVIDDGGNVGIGTSNPSGLGYGISILPFDEHGTSKVIFNRTSNSNNVTAIGFLNGGGTSGSISYNNNSVTFSTSSDYRLKENVVAISDGITRLKTLKPSRFNFKDSKDTTVDGFVAHEVTAVPEAITGTKDEVDSDNNPVYQGIDQSKLVPLLTAALQEAIAKIETLETKVAALEAA